MQCRGKYHTHRKRPIHLERRILEAVTAPIVPGQNETKPSDRCSVLHEEETMTAVDQEQVKFHLYMEHLL